MDVAGYGTMGRLLMPARKLYKTCPKCGCARFHVPSGKCSQCGYVKAPAAKLPRRHPLAFGITYWGPLPETDSMYVQWDGPACGLYLCTGNPEQASTPPGMRIRHDSASGTYNTVKQAEQALARFIAAGTS